MQPSEKNLRQQKAAEKIQKLWRSYTNRKIYKYYRDIIMFKCKGNPSKLLKGINPSEAKLLQTAVDCHVRFRLGGDTFPPNIYYKIFSKTNVCDINAFAPRDYSSLPRQAPQQKIAFSTYQAHRKEYQNEGWYLRNDNNGWRPISHKMFIKTDYVQLYSAKKVHFYHHKKQFRNQKYYKKQRLAKLKWLKHLYKKGEQQEQQVKLIENLQKAEQNDEGEQLAKKLQQQKQEMIKKFNEKDFDLQDEELDKEISDLINWSQNLDYDSYVKDWYQISTSESSANFVPKPVFMPDNSL